MIDRLISRDFDAYLSVGRKVAGENVTLAENEDVGGGTDSRIERVPDASGESVIRANPLFSEGRGRYRVELRLRP